MNKTESVYLEQVKLLYKNATASMTATLLNTIIMVLVFWRVISHYVLLPWFAANMIILLLRSLMLLRYRQVKEEEINPRIWDNRFTLGILSAGIIWGSSGILLFPSNSIAHQAFLAIVMAGMAAGALISYSSIMKISVIYILTAIGPVTIRFIINDGEVYLALGLMMIAFIIIILLATRRVNEVIVNSFKIQFENKELIESLKDEKEQVQKINNDLEFEIKERKQAEKDLHESRSKLKIIIDSAPFGAHIYRLKDNGDLIFTGFNLAAEKILNVRHDQFVNKSIENAFPNLAGTPIPETYRNVAKTGESYYSEHIEYEENSIKGVFEVSAVNIGKDQVVAFFKDITERKRAEEEKFALETQLQQSQKMEGIGTLAGGIAHDFNNILSPIMLHSEMAMEDLPEDDPLQTSMREIHKASIRARDLVKQILTFARKRSEEKIILKASLVFKEAIKFLRSTIPTTIDIRYDNRARQDTILADPTQINQIIMNLCTNAAYVMRETGGILEVIIDNEEIPSEESYKLGRLKPGLYLKISVRDNGSGISPDIMSRIFEPYFTTKRLGEGTGLGLAIIHGIIQNYGGEINVESKVGSGTTFYVHLPLIEAEHTATDEILESPMGDERILLVDDEESAVFAMKKMLERSGYRVTVRTSSIEALEVFRKVKENIDLVITDMTMPNMTGRELAIELKKLRPNIPIVLCTGFSDQINEKEAIKIGIKAFIHKPIIRSEMLTVIREVLDSASE